MAVGEWNSRKPDGERQVERLHMLLKRYCLSLTKSTWDAEDLAQDTWVKALNRLESREHANPEALLLRVAHNTWIDRVRRDTVLKRIMKWERERESDEKRRQATSEENDDSLGIELAFHALMKHLSPLQRSVFVLREVFGFSAAEAAGMLGKTEGSVKAALHRARLALSRVKEHGMERYEISPLGDQTEATVKELAALFAQGDVAEVMRLLQANVASDATLALRVITGKRSKHVSPVHRGRRPTGVQMAA